MPFDLSAKPVEVVVQPYSPLAEKFPHSLNAALVGPLESYVNELLAGLHINRISSVALKPDPARRDPLRPVRVRIDGTPCAQPITSYTSSPQEYLDSLPEQVEQIVCENRALFVSDRLVRDYRRAWGASKEIDEFLFGLLRRLAGQGFSLNRAKLWLDGFGNSESDVDSAFEEAVGTEPMAVYIYLPEDLRENRDALSSDLSRRCVELGIGPVEVIPEFEDMPRDWAFRLKINDLLLPPARKRGFGQTKTDGTDDRDVLLGAIGAAMERALPCLITTAIVAAQLESVGERYPALEEEVRQRFSPDTLTAILRDLAEEGIPVYDAKTVFECLATANGRTTAGNQGSRFVLLPETANYCHALEPGKAKDLSVRELIQIVRMGLKWHIGAKYSQNMQLAAILMHPDVERHFTSAEYRRLDGHQMRQLSRDLNRELISWRRQNPQATAPVVLLTRVDVRLEVSAAFRETFPELPVLGYFDLPEDVSIVSVGRIELAELPENCAKVREAIKVRDEEIDEEMKRDRSEEAELDPMLQGLTAMTGYVKKWNVRLDKLRETDDDEMREFLTEEVEIFEADMNRQEFIESPNSDLTDIVSDWLL